VAMAKKEIETQHHNKFHRIKNTFLYRSDDIALLLKEIKNPLEDLMCPSTPKEIQRILRRYYLMTARQDGQNHYCDHPTIITTGKKFLKNTKEAFNLLKVKPQNNVDIDTNDALVLRTTIKPKSKGAEVLERKSFSYVNLIAIQDKNGEIHYFDMVEGTEYIDEEKKRILEELEKSKIIISKEEPIRQKENTLHISSSGTRIDVMYGQFNTRKGQIHAKHHQTINIHGIEVSISTPQEGFNTQEIEEILERYLPNFEAVRRYLTNKLGAESISLDARLYLNGEGSNQVHYLDFNIERKKSYKEISTPQRLITGTDPKQYDYDDHYYRNDEYRISHRD